MKRDDETRDEELGPLFDSARVEPSEEERRRLLAAAEPILAEHRERAGRHGRTEGDRAADGPVPWTERLRALVTPRRVLAAAFTAAAIVAVLAVPWPPPVREPRSAAVVTWAEHERPDPAAPFPLASASFGRPY